MGKQKDKEAEVFVATKYRNYLYANRCPDCGAPCRPNHARCGRCREGRKAVAEALKRDMRLALAQAAKGGMS